MKRNDLNKKKLIWVSRLLLFLLVITVSLPLPVIATTAPPSLINTEMKDPLKNLPQDIFPLDNTKIELREQKITIDWSEKNTIVKGSYHFINPENKTARLKLGISIPLQNTEANNSEINISEKTNVPESPINVFYQEEDISATYNHKIKAYVWEMQIEPYAEVDLGILYTLENKIDAQGLHMTGYHFPLDKNKIWPNESYDFSFTLNFRDTQPGQITKLEPNNYSFEGNSLQWKWQTSEGKEDIIICADLLQESQDWLELLSTKEQKHLVTLTSLENYQEAASFFEKKYYNFTKTKEKQLIKLAQAYYWQKEGNTGKSLEIYTDLVNDDALFPRAYWEVGKAQEQNTNKLIALLEQIQDLKIHALLQPWLITKIPAEKTKQSPPEIAIKYADTNEGRKGIVIKSHLTDKDGDITKIILRYHWEGETEKETIFDIKPFQYDYDLLYFTIAPSSFKQLFYQFIITDSTGHEVTTEKKEAFYLNEEINSNTYILNGATLILGDYTSEEETKVHRWFKSYLKMANEAGFVPVEARNPLLIFMGQKHDFFQDYQGPLFVYHTPTPFSPNITKIPVHRYFLGYWYGQGWHTLPLHELTTLGDALMFNKGWHARIFSYLQNKDSQLFAELLCTIGEGKNWAEALKATYHLTPLKLNILTIWYFIGNYVLALTLIILFAWLSKTGYLMQLIQHFKTK